MKQSTFNVMATACIAGAVFAVVALPSAIIQRHIETATLSVTGKERLLDVGGSDGQTSSKYRNFVYANGEAFVVKDSFWNWHFRARTVYASIPEQGTCEVTLSGYRWGFVSMHQNIIEAKCAQPGD